MQKTITDFAKELITELKTADASLADACIFVQTKELPGNVTMTGLCIKRPESNAAPLIYIDNAYESYTDGASIKDLAAELMENLSECTIPSVDIASLYDFESIKDRIVCKLVSGASDRYLSERPSLPLGDTGIRIVWDIAFPESDTHNGTCTVPVTNRIAGCWDDITPDEIHACALRNTPLLRPMLFVPVSDMLNRYASGRSAAEAGSGADASSIPPSDPFCVLTNQNGCNGAAAILYPEAISALNAAFPHGCWLLPSSTHEWLVLDKQISDNPDDLRDMVRTVNAQEVRPDEVLSNDVFEFKDGMPICVK